MKKLSKIAIIGAGLAGLTAAYRLSQKGIPVDVYEARNRVGGRVFSVFVKNYLGQYSTVELGGQNITDGGEAEHLLNLCEELSLEIETKEIDLQALVYYQEHYVDLYNELSTFFKENPTIHLSESYKSMGELINQLFIDYPVLKLALRSRMTAYEGVPVDDQSVYHNIDTFKCMLEGGLSKFHERSDHKKNNIIIKYIKEGMAKLAMKMVAQLGNHVHLNKALIKIQKADNKFKLFFHDESIALYDAVVLAIPASTYENIAISEDIIPQKRWEKMGSLAYGQNYKIICPFNLSGSITHRSVISESYLSFFVGDQDVALLYASRPLLNIEKELDVVQVGYNIKDKINFKNIHTAKDENYISYDNPVMHVWSEDVYARGSYSGYSVNLSAELDQKNTYKNIEFKKLFEPIDDNLFFIGEHTTILDCVGTMEAAVESGERVARYITAPVE